MNKYPDLCDAATSALLVVDIQTTLTVAMSDQEAQQMLNNTRVLVEAADQLEIPVFLTEQYPKGLGRTDDTILEKLPETGNKYEKTGFSACAANGLVSALKESACKQVVIVGQETHVCIAQTAFELLENGYRVFVVEDAVCSRKQSHKFFALERMLQVGIVVTNYESVMFEWLRDASHPKFKILSKMIR